MRAWGVCGGGEDVRVAMGGWRIMESVREGGGGDVRDEESM